MFYYVNAQEPGGPKAANTTFIYSGIPVLEVKNGRTRVRRNFEDSVDSFVEKCKNARNGKGVISTTQWVSFAVGRKHESKIVDFSLVL